MSGLRAGRGKPRRQGASRVAVLAPSLDLRAVDPASCFGTESGVLSKGGNGFSRLYALKSNERSGRLPCVSAKVREANPSGCAKRVAGGEAAASAPARAGRCSVQARRGVVESEALEGRGSLREERRIFTETSRGESWNTG
jgi:hypothetical protein